MNDREVDMTDAAAQISYDAFLRDFGAKPITEELLERFEKVTGAKPHRFLKTGLYFSHRDLNLALDAYEKGEPIYIYTGRGPSSDNLHLGHMIPFIFSKWLQEVFHAVIVIQLTDDEKFLRDRKLAFEQLETYAVENARDILAVGFDPARTFIFMDSWYMQHMYRLVCTIERAITAAQLKGIFGFTDGTNVGYHAFPPKQAAPSFSEAFPHIFGTRRVTCVIPCGMEQDTYFRMCRDVAPRLGLRKPVIVHGRFLPALHGAGTKMSASVETSAIYLTDTPDQIRAKVAAAPPPAAGVAASEDVAFEYLEVFLDDAERVARLKADADAGALSAAAVREELAGTLTEFVTAHGERRAAISREDIAQCMAMRPMDFMP